MTADTSQKWYNRILARIEGREIVVARGLITLIVVVAATWGADLTDIGQRAEQTLDAIGAFVALLGLTWIRAGVSPYKEVAYQEKPDGTIIAGPASGLPTGSPVLDVLAYPNGVPADESER